MVLSLEHQPLRYTFETDEYACVSLNGEDKQQVIFVHSISERIDSSEAEKYCLSVTRYSFLDSTYPFKERRLEDDSTINGKELVLRFRNFDKMGTRDDAEVIKLEDILSVRGIDTTATDGVTHVVQQPQGLPRTLSLSIALSKPLQEIMSILFSAGMPFALPRMMTQPV